jgi:hypothetical protein
MRTKFYFESLKEQHSEKLGADGKNKLKYILRKHGMD